MNKNYNSGRTFEYRVKKHLEKRGYYVMRSAGSKSPFDLIAIPNNKQFINYKVLLIQCKHGVKISKNEKNKILDFDMAFSSTIYCIIAWSKSHGKIEFEIYDYRFKAWEKMGWLN